MLPPHTTNDTYSLVHSELIYSTLTRQDKDGGIVPGLAEKWDIAPDGLTYTFSINPKATWHDGKPVTADDVAFSLTSLSDPRTKSIYASRFTSVKGVKAFRDGSAPSVAGYQVIDPKTFRIVLDSPVAPMLGQLGVQAAILPKHVLGAVKPEELDKHPFWSNPTVGSGPFKFIRYQTDQFMELDRHDQHHLGAAGFPKLLLRIGNQDTLQVQLQKGEVDIAAVPIEEVPRLKTLPNLNVYAFQSTVAQSLYFNLDRPFLKDLRVRQAMSYAVDRASIAKTVNGDAALAVYGPVNAPAWAISPNLMKYPYDPDKARQLLKDAGWSASQKILYRYPTGNKARELMAPLIQDLFKGVGIDLDLRVSDFATMQSDAREGKFDLLSLGNQNGYDPDSLANQYKSNAFPPEGVNFGKYANKRVDEIFTAAAAEREQAKRATLYHEFQDFVSRELPRIWVLLDPETIAATKRIGGIMPAPAWGLLRSIYWNIHEWKVTD